VPEAPIQAIVCCLGQPVAGNPTQFVMENAFTAAGLDWRYLTLEVAPEDLEAAMQGMRAMGFRGGNLAPPHEQAAIPYLDQLSDNARLLESVNCIYQEKGLLIGENLRGKGLLNPLKMLVELQDAQVVVFGAGSTARAFAVELAQAGVAELVVVNRSAETGQQLVNLLNDQLHVPARLVHLSTDYAPEENAKIVVNATTIGRGDEEARLPLDRGALRPDMVVADAVVNPPRTRLIRDAQERGCRVLEGLGMMVDEAAAAFRIWTGREPDLGVMREALEEFLEL